MEWPNSDEPSLSVYQKNEIYHAIEETSVPVSDFKLVTSNMMQQSAKPGLVAVIYHPATGSLFAIREVEAGTPAVPPKEDWLARRSLYKTNAEIGARKTEDQLSDIKWRSPRRAWGGIPKKIRRWVLQVADFAKRLEEYQAIPDLWEQLSQGEDFLTGHAEENLSNTPFTPVEQAAISAQLKGIKDYIATTHELTSEQISQVQAKLDHAEEASRRIGRKDWITLFNGAVFSLVLTDLITPPTAQHVILMALHGIGHLFGIGGPPPPLRTVDRTAQPYNPDFGGR